MSDECKHAYDLDGRCSRCGDDFGIEIERLRQQLKEAQDPAADGPLQSLIATLRERVAEIEREINSAKWWADKHDLCWNDMIGGEDE